MKLIFDAIYRAAAWFSRLLRPAGWFDHELTDAPTTGDAYIPSAKARKKHRMPLRDPAVAYVRGVEIALSMGAARAVGGDNEPRVYSPEEILLLLDEL